MSTMLGTTGTTGVRVTPEAVGARRGRSTVVEIDEMLTRRTQLDAARLRAAIEHRRWDAPARARLAIEQGPMLARLAGPAMLGPMSLGAVFRLLEGRSLDRSERRVGEAVTVQGTFAITLGNTKWRWMLTGMAEADTASACSSGCAPRPITVRRLR
jgi:hypothetical protein